MNFKPQIDIQIKEDKKIVAFLTKKQLKEILAILGLQECPLTPSDITERVDG